ncbi:MAG TPA: phosphoethanolamine--lipid A transferase [Burkholderiaceae bacterium]|nr:phosphoethanolamine--lipid A transferase [Burkholderiaceae bacterium]
MSTELLIVAASLFFTVFSNGPFWSAMLGGRNWSAAATWLFAGALFVILTAIHSLLLGLVVTRRTAKPVLLLLFLLTAAAAFYMRRYKVFLDLGMLRNILHTDVNEAKELLSFALFFDIALYGVLPGILVMRLELARRRMRRATLVRIAFLFSAAAVALGGIALVFQDLSSAMRNQKETRYLITPGNYLISSARVLTLATVDAHAARMPLGSDAALGAAWADRKKPALLLLVVGETARAANWGLNGYARQTTPRLAQTDIVNYRHVTSCGSNTEVSLPCMFSPFGRKNYDEEKIHRYESLLHVLKHGGFKTLWRDNQSGCKGVCDGLEQQQLRNSKHATLCNDERCLDEILLENLDVEISKETGNLVVVLHQLGNHGPAYWRRYPETFRRFIPTCDTADLGKCTRQEIVNSYDNALLYTDHFLDRAIRLLKAQTSHHAAMIYVSDHGESLGEKGVYLHGLPYAIAPKEQTEVPMVMWLSAGFASSFGLDTGCLRKHASDPISHDYLFHTTLGMLQVTTQVYDRSYDLSANCHG